MHNLNHLAAAILLAFSAAGAFAQAPSAQAAAPVAQASAYDLAADVKRWAAVIEKTGVRLE